MDQAPPAPPPAPRLRDPANRVSTKAPVLWAVSAAALSLVVLLVLLGAALFGWFPVPWWVWLVYAVAAAAYTIGMPTIRYRVHRWETTADAVYTQTGWLTREQRVAPLSRVQTVDLQQGVVGRVLGLATVTVTTASAAGPISITDVDRDVAERLAADLVRRTAAEAGDAT